ncbi:amidohydrolase family protein [[Eubacterium] cellulosolvens]
MIFDAHTHVGKGDPFHYSDSGDSSILVEDLLTEMDRNNVDNAIVMSNFHLPHRLWDSNVALAKSIENYSNRFFGFAWLDPRIEDCCNQLDTLVKEFGFRGLKLHPVLGGYYLTNKTVLRLIEKAISLKIPIMVHTGWGLLGSAAYVGKLAEIFPRGQFIIAHMIDPECINVTKRYENVFLETSYAQHPRRITQAVNTIGSNRLLYGSDYPLGGGIEFEISKINLAKITDEDKRMILYDNISRLIE